MFYISDFCRVCFENEKPLIDIIKKTTDSETLINKLKLCVSEIEWSTTGNVLMCQTCIGKLNSAFEFKKQCLQSAQALESYVSQLKMVDSQEGDRVGASLAISVNRNEVKQELVDEYVKIQKDDEQSQKQQSFIRVKSSQQLLSPLSNIILTAAGNAQNTQTTPIFLNFIPTTALKLPPPGLIVQPNPVLSKPPAKDANQNVFFINNTLHKIVPVLPTPSPSPATKMIETMKANTVSQFSLKDSIQIINDSLNISIKEPSKATTKSSGRNSILKEVSKDPSQEIKLKSRQTKVKDLNISRILTESKTEELSVEIDPMCFGPEDEPNNEEGNVVKDWEELISTNKIGHETATKDHLKNYSPLAGVTIVPSKPSQVVPSNNFMQIRPKMQKQLVMTDVGERMVEFAYEDHFLAPFMEQNMEESKYFMCEQCGQVCDTFKSLKNHIKIFHLGKFPYRCPQCSSVFAIKTQFEAHVQKHMLTMAGAFPKDTITLEDLSYQNEAMLFPNSQSPPAQPAESSEDANAQFEYKCDACPRSFNSSHGLSRHKVRKHNQAAKKKYFIKGMKNAKCDICNREFSTQSYLQLHIKLHYRKNDYRLKVFNKDKYNKERKAQQNASPGKKEKKPELINTADEDREANEGGEDNEEAAANNSSNDSSVHENVNTEETTDDTALKRKRKSIKLKLKVNNDATINEVEFLNVSQNDTCPSSNDTMECDENAEKIEEIANDPFDEL